MLDVELLRNHTDKVRQRLGLKGVDISLVDHFISEDKQWRMMLQEVEELKMKRNTLTPKGKPSEDQRQSLKALSEEIKQRQAAVVLQEKRVKEFALQLPNMPMDTVPVGQSEDDNKIIRVEGQPRSFSFSPQPHEELGVQKGFLSFDEGAQLAGSRFVVYHGKGARLERALINFMLDQHCEQHGYEEVQPPVIVNSRALLGTGQLPKFSDDLFKLSDTDYWLSPTAEVQLTNLFQNTVLSESDLPKLYTAYTPCFRKEAGSYGKDIKGIIRLHQFNKVELVKFVSAETSMQHLESLLSHAETILKALKLPYRVVELCTGDLGFSAAKTYDLEVWFPSQQCYREISSCSNFLDFQSRRAMIRYKCSERGTIKYVHTINGSGLAIGRTLAALIENHQQADGSIVIPEALKEYMKEDKI